jgi:hypothetical protein
MLRSVLWIARCSAEAALAPFLALLSIASRLSRKTIDVGIGPEPIVSHIYHKAALAHYGYTAETFVSSVYFITDCFDVRGDRFLVSRYLLTRAFTNLYLFSLCIFRYKALYCYFNGGPLSFGTVLLWRLEPFFYKLAGTRVVVMPYGSDVQDLSRSPNLLFKNAMAKDYPGQRLRRRQVASKIDLWTTHASHVVSGCEWVDYMYFWDTLVPAHFCIDTDEWKPALGAAESRADSDARTPFRVLHAPNHRNVKGTRHLVDAVRELKEEGLPIELLILEKVPHEEIKRAMSTVDIVVDQLIIGWYGMFAVEGMAMGKPVLCQIRPDLEALFTTEGLIAPGELPIVKCSALTIKETIRKLVLSRSGLNELSKRSSEYAIRHHSLHAIGKVFDAINRSLGMRPSRECSIANPPKRQESSLVPKGDMP